MLIGLKKDVKMRDITTPKIITQEEWYWLLYALEDHEKFQDKISDIIIIGALTIVLIGFLYSVVRIFLLDPLMPLWNIANDQTRATLVFSFFLTIVATILTHIIRSLYEKSTKINKT